MFKKVFLLNNIKWNKFKTIQYANQIQNFKRFYSKSSKKTYPKRIFSGIQPTGSIHIGNYLGAIQNWIDLQNNGENVIWSIVDMHSITLPHDRAILKKNILTLTATLLACGIDPKKSILFQQSTVSMHAELNWILSCLVTMPRLARQPQYKEKGEKLKEVPLGLYVYPVLQSADILLYKATHVPVGSDQVQHIQLAEHLAQKFNSTYGETFPMPIAIVKDEASRIKSLREPTEKMSKSCTNTKSCLNLIDEPDILQEKIKKSVTDFISEVTYEPEKRPGVANLVNIHSMLTGKSPEEICKEAEGLNTGQYKLVLADVVIEKFNPVRKLIKTYEKEPEYLQEVLQDGAKRAELIAIENWLEIRNKVGYGNSSLSILTEKMHLKLNR